MALPVYVVNFDELLHSIALDNVNVEIDNSNIENLLNEYFPELLAAIRSISPSGGIDGTQKIKGFASNGQKIFFTTDSLIALTGVTFSQSKFDACCMDRWYLKISKTMEIEEIEEVVEGEDSSIYKDTTLLDGIFAKDALQHKHFERFYLVPPGGTIMIEPFNASAIAKTFWFDLEYLDNVTVHMPPPATTQPQPLDEDYLKMFVTEDPQDPNYIDPNSIAVTYPKLDTYWGYPGSPLSHNFYEGRNELRIELFEQSAASSGPVTNFHKYLWKLVSDSQADKNITELDNGFVNAKTYMSDIGITNISHQVSIYMTYHAKVINLAFQSFTSEYDCGDNLDGFTKYVQKDKCFVFDWIDWCDIEPNPDAGGFAITVEQLPGFKSCLNIEPQIKDFPIDGNGVQKVHQYKVIGSQQGLYAITEGLPDPYSSYSWDNISDKNIEKEAMLAQVTIHEMGHAVDAYAKYRGDSNRLAYTDEWLAIWKWTTVATASQFRANDSYKKYPKYLTDYHMNWNMANGEPPLTYYGCTDPKEDFAETYACYVTNRKYLQDKYPKRYAFMQKYIDVMVEV